MPEPGGFARWMEQGWYTAPPRLVLRPLAALHGLIMALRGWAYRSGLRASRHPGVPTIVVGNFTVGGTGKTPLVIWLAARLVEQGRRPGIVLRGYGGRQRAPHLVGAEDGPELVGDEAVLLVQRTGCPVAVGIDRPAAASLLVRAGCDTVIADDGLQHLALARDLGIIVIDGARGFGNGALLPAGPLRDSPARLGTADLVVIHGEDQNRVASAGLAPVSMHLEARELRELGSGRARSLELLRGATVHAVAGIGHPARFFALLRQLGAHPIEHPQADHHRFRAADLAFGDAHPVVMTEKDAVKCAALVGAREGLFFLPVAAVLGDADAARVLDRVQAIRRT